MPEEVTYATLKFPNLSKSKISQESYSLRRAENREVPEMEIDGEAESRAEGVESTAELAESRAVAGHSTLSKVWCAVSLISLILNLVVLAGLGTLGIINYWKLILGNRTEYDVQQSNIQQLEENLTIWMNMYNNVSNEHNIFKNMTQNTIKELNNFTSQYCEDLKQKENDVGFSSCPESWMCNGNTNKCHAQMNMDKNISYNSTQLFFRCLTSPISWMNLNCTLKKANQAAGSVLKLCIVTSIHPPFVVKMYQEKVKNFQEHLPVAQAILFQQKKNLFYIEEAHGIENTEGLTP